MAQDEISLYNLALSAAGARGSISAPTEQSREAEICRQWYAPTRRWVLRAAAWSSAKAFASLALLKERADDQWVLGDPNPAYTYAYALPEKYLQARYLYGYNRFEISLIDSETQALMTESPSPILYYTRDQERIGLWDPDLYLAVAHALGAFIALPLNGKTQQARAAQGQANALILSARAAAANESFEPIDSMPDWLQVRGSAFGPPTNRFVYPNGPLIAVPNV